MSDKLYVIPMDEKTRENLLRVDRRTKEVVRLSHHLILSHDWECNTIANAFVEIMIRMLALQVVKNHDSNCGINFYDLFEAYVTLKKDSDAEKEGNINIVFKAGPKIDEFIHDPIPFDKKEYEYHIPQEVFGNGDPDMGTLFEALGKTTRKELSETYGITIMDDTDQVKGYGNWAVIAIAYNFMENIIRELLMQIGTSNKLSASINFNDNIEIHAITKPEGIVIAMRPGMNAKLLIKSDAATEEYDDEE